MRFLDPRIHGILDIVIVLMLFLGPFLFGLGGSPALISWIVGALLLIVTLLTDFPMGRRRTIPFVVHGLVELVIGVFLILMPVLGGYGPGSPAKRFYTIVGAFVLVVWALTAYRSQPRETFG